MSLDKASVKSIVVLQYCGAGLLLNVSSNLVWSQIKYNKIVNFATMPLSWNPKEKQRL